MVFALFFQPFPSPETEPNQGQMTREMLDFRKCWKLRSNVVSSSSDFNNFENMAQSYRYTRSIDHPSTSLIALCSPRRSTFAKFLNSQDRLEIFFLEIRNNPQNPSSRIESILTRGDFEESWYSAEKQAELFSFFPRKDAGILLHDTSRAEGKRVVDL